MIEARLGQGTYTDDTRMAIALAESLLEHVGIDVSVLGRAFADAHEPPQIRIASPRSAGTRLSIAGNDEERRGGR